jgi:hypothetical protein
LRREGRDGFDWDVLHVKGNDVDGTRQFFELAGVIEGTGDHLPDLGTGCIAALIQEYEAQSQWVARQCQHATELASPDDADPHARLASAGSGWASTWVVCCCRY